MRVDLNVDVGEDGGADPALLALASSANVACGGHAGGGGILLGTLAAARAAGVAVGAHPGYPDRKHFGRLETGMPTQEIAAETLRQLAVFASAAGNAPRHVKPHGALYHRLDADADAASAFCRAVRAAAPEAWIFAFAGGGLAAVATGLGLRVCQEGFIDRGYGPDGRLIPRDRPGALITSSEIAASQALRLVRGGGVDSLCIHGDGPDALTLLGSARRALEKAGVRIAAPELLSRHECNPPENPRTACGFHQNPRPRTR